MCIRDRDESVLMVSVSSGDGTGSGVLSVDVQDNAYGAVEVTIQVTDSSGEFDRERIDITVVAVDDAPELSDIPDQEVMAGETFVSFDLDDYVTELDGDGIDWSYSVPSGEVFGFVHSLSLSGSGNDYELGFGFHPDATDGYDEGIDFYAPPAPPSGFDAALSWEFERYYTQVLALDGDYSEHSYDIQLQHPDDNVIEISWDNSGWVDDGTFVLQDAFGGVFVNVDMVSGTGTVNPGFGNLDVTDPVRPVLTITNGAITTLRLKVVPLSPERELSVDIDSESIVTITYPEGWYGVETVTFTATDNTAGSLSDSDEAVFTVVESPNTAPIAEDVWVNTLEDNSVEVSLSGSDADGDDLSFEITTDPVHGSVSEIGFSHYYGSYGYGRIRSQGRDNPFEGLVNPTNLSGVFQGQATIDGESAESGDWIAAFDSDGNISGATEIIVSDGIGYISLSIYGDDGTTTGVDEGINGGESFYLRLWDSSSDAVLEYSDGFDCWYNNNGAPMSGCGSISTVYDFEGVDNPDVGPTAGFSFSVNDLTVMFTDESVPGDSDISSWSWDFGDGGTSTEQNPVHTYSVSGTYSVSLMVTDAIGLSDNVSGFVTVTDGESSSVTHIVYYIPDLNYNGSDSFGYRVFDGTEYSEEAWVSITIAVSYTHLTLPTNREV